MQKKPLETNDMVAYCFLHFLKWFYGNCTTLCVYLSNQLSMQTENVVNHYECAYTISWWPLYIEDFFSIEFYCIELRCQTSSIYTCTCANLIIGSHINWW